MVRRRPGAWRLQQCRGNPLSIAVVQIITVRPGMFIPSSGVRCRRVDRRDQFVLVSIMVLPRGQVRRGPVLAVSFIVRRPNCFGRRWWRVVPRLSLLCRRTGTCSMIGPFLVPIRGRGPTVVVMSSVFPVPGRRRVTGRR